MWLGFCPVNILAHELVGWSAVAHPCARRNQRAVMYEGHHQRSGLLLLWNDSESDEGTPKRLAGTLASSFCFLL